jgi:hypothetical protein
MDYRRYWSKCKNATHFGEGICEAWTSEYLQLTGADAADLVVVDPGSGFSYLFDLAGTLRGQRCCRAPRVVGVWGLPLPVPGPHGGPEPYPNAWESPAQAVRR